MEHHRGITEFSQMLEAHEMKHGTSPRQYDDDAMCAVCGCPLELVRPGKHQHPDTDCPQAQRG